MFDLRTLETTKLTYKEWGFKTDPGIFLSFRLNIASATFPGSYLSSSSLYLLMSKPWGGSGNFKGTTEESFVEPVI